jgi:hypothetical protein
MKYQIAQLALLVALVPAIGFSGSQAKFGEVGYAGNGCEADSDTVVKLTPDSLTIIPKAFHLSSATDQQELERKKCDIAVGVSVPAGYQIGVGETTMHAFASLGDASSGDISVSAGFSADPFTEKSAVLDAKTHNNLTISNKTEQWAACGSDSILRLKASALIRSTPEQKDYLTVNSFSVKILYRSCHNEA